MRVTVNHLIPVIWCSNAERVFLPWKEMEGEGKKNKYGNARKEIREAASWLRHPVYSMKSI